MFNTHNNTPPIWSEEDYWDHLEYEKVRGEFFSKTRITGIDKSVPILPNPFIIPSASKYGRVISIGEGAFMRDERLINVIIPDTVYKIEDDAFEECENLRRVSIPDGVVSIGHYAFFSCQKLEEIKLGSKLEIIGKHAFAYCRSLRSLTIPQNVKMICGSAFFECTNIEQLIILNHDIKLIDEPFDSRAPLSVLVSPLVLAEDLIEIFSGKTNLTATNWIINQQQITEKPYINIGLNRVEKAEYTNGAEGWSVHFEITNNQYTLVNVSVLSTFVIRPTAVEQESFWLSDGLVNDYLLEHCETIEAISGFANDTFNERDFAKGAFIGIRVIVDEEKINSDENLLYDREYYDVLMASSTDGWLPDLAELPREGGYTFVFQNMGTGWELVATNIMEKPDDPQIYEIEFADFVVRTNTYACNANHDVETIQAFVNILAEDGCTFKATVMAGYCKHCNCYFILETDFKALQQRGKILCQLLTLEEYTKHGNAIFNGEDMKAESVLKRCGYNVNATENLSSEQRQKILALVLDNKIYTATELCGFLDWLINYHGKSRTRNMGAAIRKWTEDRMFVQQYGIQGKRTVDVNSISHRP